MSIKIYKDGKWQLFPGTGININSTNGYTKEESDNKFALKSDITTVSGKVDDLENRIDQINTGCEDCISQGELASAISEVDGKIDNLVTTVSGKVDKNEALFTLNGDQVSQGDKITIETSGSSITVDDELSLNSENPVQNKVLTSYLKVVETALELAGENLEDLKGFRDNEGNKKIISGDNEVKWSSVVSSPLYLKTINGQSLIGSENITISGEGGDITINNKPSIIVFAYKISDERPNDDPFVTVDINGNITYTEDWKGSNDPSIIEAISNKSKVWYKYTTFEVGGGIIGSWSEAIPFAVDGLPGTNGLTQQIIQIYQRSNSEVKTPSSSTIQVSTLLNNTWSAPDNWHKEIPITSASPCYMSTAFVSFDSTNTNANIEAIWSNPIKILENGTGSDGRMLYPAGIWSPAIVYSRDSESTPFVLYQNNDTSSAEYYVLMKDSSRVNELNVTPGSVEDIGIWKRMETLDVAYAKVLLTEMGTIGNATFYKNLMFSSDYATNSTSEWINTNEDTSSINLDSTEKPSMAINFNDGSAYFAKGNMLLNSDGSIRVSNIEYDINNVVSTVTNESKVSNFYNYSIDITDFAAVVDTNKVVTDENGEVVYDPASASIGNTFIYYNFNLPNKDSKGKARVTEGVVINIGDIQADIHNSDKYVMFYNGTKITQIKLGSKSILKYFYHEVENGGNMLFIDSIGTVRDNNLYIGTAV